MKVIFLDIDGVLNCKKTPNPRKFPYVVDKRLLVRFKRLLEKTGAKVVLSSTWRYDPAGLFSAKHWSIPFIDITPDMPKRRAVTKSWRGSKITPELPALSSLTMRMMNSMSCRYSSRPPRPD